MTAPYSQEELGIMTPFSLIPVQPSGSYPSRAFVDGVDASGRRFGRIADVTVPEYPASAQGKVLHALRIDQGITLRDMATRCGLGVVEYSGLECGRYQLSEDEWKRIGKLVMGGDDE